MSSAPVTARSALWQAVTRFDRAKLLPQIAVRNALGIALPLAVGVAIGDPGGGLVMTTGALNVSFSDGSDPYLHRGRRMLAASLCCALAVLAGGLSGRLPALVVLLAAGCAWLAGMMAAINQTVTDIGAVTLVTLVVFSSQAMTPERAVIAAGLALAGGLLQTVFALAFWPVHRYAPERRALAELYSGVARAAASGAPAAEAPPASAQSTDAQSALSSLGGDRSLEAERYLALLSQAERIRLALLTLFRLRVRLAREGAATEAEILDRSMTLASRVLSSIATTLPEGEPADPHPECIAELHGLSASLRGSGRAAMVRDARAQLDALVGQLRSAAELAAHVTPQGRALFEKREAEASWRLRLEGARDVLRANLHRQSAAFRHAVRLSVCVAIGEMAGHMLHPGRAYWVPMTIAIVLKPDFTSTFSRGLLRLAGTLAGLAVATGLFRFLDPAPAAQVALIAVLAVLLRWFGPANYGVFVTALTALVVLLFAVIGVSPPVVIAARGLNTLLGGLIALAAYGLWPTWERTQIAESLARMLDAYRAYFAAIRDSYVDPEHSYTLALDHARLDARRARSNLEASLTRLRSEPGVTAARLAALDSILATSHRLVHAFMSLEAGLIRSRPVPARVAFRPFAADVDLTLDRLAAALRGAAVRPVELPDLREDHHALVSSGDPGVERYALVNVETDRVTNSLNTLAGEVLAWTAVNNP